MSYLLKNEDCLLSMAEIPNGTIDLILTDPPYGINYRSNRNQHKAIFNDSDPTTWKSVISSFFVLASRLLTPTGCLICFAPQQGTNCAWMTLEGSKYLTLIANLIWQKPIGMGWRYRPCHENILLFGRSRKDYNFYDTSNALKTIISDIKMVRQSNARKDTGLPTHPTQKPIELMQKFIDIHTLPGDVILDPFMGSGTTGVACQKSGRHFIGYELDEKYYAIANARMLMQK